MTGPCRGNTGLDAVHHTDEVFDALAAGRPVSSDEETVRLLQALVADVRGGAPAAPQNRRRARIRENRGPLRCR